MEGEGDLLEGDEEGGGWDVDAEDLELPPDLVRRRACKVPYLPTSPSHYSPTILPPSVHAVLHEGRAINSYCNTFTSAICALRNVLYCAL